ncbi:mechanosensitive ion channel family protein [Paraliomyxa miuraensis]|uniref:mechanosensitive ion channel family protein n=1 Tax=Paraliomyxa miuraensis TaxID=376150 RepID=UPI00225C0713|nr:mechanosensitive ion channel family protein [Paraliomyxa miuraensis]MCX4244472.1 mechanosensitive ion channel family protein [Paraliomyxa miuraensis]
MDGIRGVLEWGVGGVTVGDVGVALVALVVGIVAGRVAQRVLRGVDQRLPEGSLGHAALDATSEPLVWALRLAGLWAAITSLPLPKLESVDLPGVVGACYQATVIGLATWLGVRLISELSVLWARRASGTEDTFDDQLVPIVRKTAKVILVCVGGVMVLQNLGYSVGSLLAGLGIGTAAIAFASKDTIANFFGSLVVFIDRPFQVGDWVEIGDVEGTVETVDIRTTRIRTFANSLITVPNSQMTVTAIQNWSRMKKRRIKMEIGVSYDTTPEQMRASIAAIRGIIAGDERFHHDFYLVNFHALGDSSLIIYCYFFTITTHWAEYMQTREDFLLEVMVKLREVGVEIAFPTRTVHLVGPGAPAVAALPAAMQRQTPL